MTRKTSNLEKIMVQRGLLTAEALEQALHLKTRQGGSLAVNLVVAGAIDDLTLASFYSDRYQIEHVTEEELRAVGREAFGLIPVEIIYDAGIFPLRLEGESQERLVVGMIDPSEPDVLEEAAFFAGLELVPRLLSIGQMARHYQRLTGKFWKVDWNTVKARRRIQDARQQARAQAEHTPPPRPLATPVVELLEQTQSLDASLHSLFSGQEEEREEVLIAVVSVDEGLEQGEHSEGVIELIRRKPGDGGAPVTEPGAPPSRGNVIVDTTRLSAQEAERRIEALVHGTTVISEPTPPAPLHTAPLEVLSAPSSQDERALDLAMEQADTSWMDTGPSTSIDEPPISLREEAIKAPSQPPLRPRHMPRSQDVLAEEDAPSIDIGMVFRLDPWQEGAAAPGPLRQDVEALDQATERDEVGRAAARFLRRFYKRVLLMTLRGSVASLWIRAIKGDIQTAQSDEHLSVHDFLCLRRVVQEEACYLGPTMRSGASPEAAHALKELLGGGLPLSALICPIFIKGRMIAFFYCDEGPRQAVVLDRDSLTLLQHHMEQALQRIILLRKRRPTAALRAVPSPSGDKD